MPTVARLINIRPEFFDANGDPLVGGKLFFYLAGTTTKANTYNSSTGVSANTNPIILNARGEPAVEIWLDISAPYKAVLAPATDTDPPSSPIWTEDNITSDNFGGTNTQGSNLVWGPTVAIPTTGTYFEVASGSGTATAFSGAIVNGTLIEIRWLVSGCSLASGSGLILQNDDTRSVGVNAVMSFIKVTGGWIEQSSKELPDNVRVGALLALANFAR